MNVVKRSRNNIFSKTFFITLFLRQNKYHRYGVLLHTLKVTYATIKNKDFKFVASGLFHDVGKPFVAYQKPQDVKVNEYSFTNHEEISYQIVKNWFFLSDFTKQIIRYHYLIRDINKCTKKNNYKRLSRLQRNYNKLDTNFKKDLEQFLIYDDYGKQ